MNPSLQFPTLTDAMPDMLSTDAAAPIRSSCAEDPDFAEVLVEFLESMAGRPALLRTLFGSGRIDELRVAAHQLKGAGGGYGFAGLSTIAAELESACKQQHADDIAAALERLTAYIARMAP